MNAGLPLNKSIIAKRYLRVIISQTLIAKRTFKYWFIEIYLYFKSCAQPTYFLIYYIFDILCNFFHI